MKKKERQKIETFADQAELALREAVREVVEDHRRTGRPLAVMRDGKAVLAPPYQVALPVVAESAAEYGMRERPAKRK